MITGRNFYKRIRVKPCLFAAAFAMGCAMVPHQLHADGAGLEMGDAFFEATLFDKAAAFYEGVIKGSGEKSLHAEAKRKLAHTYAAQGRDGEAIALLETDETGDAKLLLGTLYNRQHKYEKAIGALRHYFKSVQNPDPKARLELAAALYEQGGYKESRSQLDLLTKSTPSEAIQNLAELYLAKIDLAENNHGAAESRLAALDEKLEADHPLKYEIFFYRGEARNASGDFAAAASFYEKALPKKNAADVAWGQTALLRLAWSYVRLAADPKTAENERGAYFAKAEEIFHRAEASGSTPSVLLEIARFQVMKGEKFNDTAALAVAMRLLETPSVKEYPESRYLRAHLLSGGSDARSLASALELLEKTLETPPGPPWEDRCRYLLGTLFLKSKESARAQETFLALTGKTPPSEMAGEAWYWAAAALEESSPGDEKIRQWKRRSFEEYPGNALAPQAYFTFFSYRDYLQGERPAIKHLEGFKDAYPESPLVISAHYLIGMDFKRDRKTAEGKWIRKRDLNKAIETLQEAEIAFDNLYGGDKIPRDELAYYAKIRYRAMLERALCNMAIADDSQGAKKKIFLEYAIEVLEELTGQFKGAANPLVKQLGQGEAYPHLQEEGSYWLAQAFTKAGEEAKAEEVLSAMIDKYRDAKVTRGYFLSRVWYDRGVNALKRKEPARALNHFMAAEDAAKGKILSTDQRIDLWIQQSLCYKDMGDTDMAMLLLSKAINDDAISGLRIKAMYLRSDIYAAQGRHELARKQLEATSKKGGEWAHKAKQLLEQNYGNR